MMSLFTDPLCRPIVVEVDTINTTSTMIMEEKVITNLKDMALKVLMIILNNMVNIMVNNMDTIKVNMDNSNSNILDTNTIPLLMEITVINRYPVQNKVLMLLLHLHLTEKHLMLPIKVMMRVKLPVLQ